MKKKEVHVELFGNETQLFEVRIINFLCHCFDRRSEWAKLSLFRLYILPKKVSFQSLVF